MRGADEDKEASGFDLISMGYRKACTESDGRSEGRLLVRGADSGCEVGKGTVYWDGLGVLSVKLSC